MAKPKDILKYTDLPGFDLNLGVFFNNRIDIVWLIDIISMIPVWGNTTALRTINCPSVDHIPRKSLKLDTNIVRAILQFNNLKDREYPETYHITTLLHINQYIRKKQLVRLTPMLMENRVVALLEVQPQY